MAPASGLVGDSVGSSHLTPQAPLAFSVAGGGGVGHVGVAHAQPCAAGVGGEGRG